MRAAKKKQEAPKFRIFFGGQFNSVYVARVDGSPGWMADAHLFQLAGAICETIAGLPRRWAGSAPYANDGRICIETNEGTVAEAEYVSEVVRKAIAAMGAEVAK